MRKLFILTIFISSLMISSIAHAEWTEISRAVNGDVMYADLENIKKHDGKIYFWVLSDFLKPYKGMMSAKDYFEGDCRKQVDGSLFKARKLSGTYYDAPMGKGAVLGRDDFPTSDWFYPKQKQMFYMVLSWVCIYSLQRY